MSQPSPHQVAFQRTEGTSGLAIAGLIFSGLGWLTCGLLCILGAPLSFLALFSRGPKGIAVAGLIVGFPGVLFFVFVGIGMIGGVVGLSNASREVAKSKPGVQQGTPDAADRLDEQASADIVPIEGFDDYTIKVTEHGSVVACQVWFEAEPPSTRIASEVVRGAVRALAEKDGSREILGMAFNSAGETLPESSYGGAVTYEPGDGNVRTMDERAGLETTDEDKGAYLVRIQESETASGITPRREWLHVWLVFPGYPSDEKVHKAVAETVDQQKSRELDISMYVYNGEKSNPVTWSQIRAPNGQYKAIEYKASTGDVSANWDWDASKATEKTESPALEDAQKAGMPTPPERGEETESRDENAGTAESEAEEPGTAFRTWTDSTGKFRVEAEFVSMTGDTVTLEKKGGEQIKVPFGRLSESDREFIEDKR